jgi:hypothetical protein
MYCVKPLSPTPRLQSISACLTMSSFQGFDILQAFIQAFSQLPFLNSFSRPVRDLCRQDDLIETYPTSKKLIVPHTEIQKVTGKVIDREPQSD